MTVAIHNPPASNPTSSLYTVTVDGVSAGTYATDLGHFINFSTDEDTIIVVTFNTTVTTASLSPKRKNIPLTINGSTVTFVLSGANKNGNYVLEINDPGQTDDAQTPTWAPLFIFANPLEVNPPTGDTANIKYLGPGNWYVSSQTVITAGLPGTVSDNYYDIANGKQLYLAPGAVLRGKLKFGSDSSGGAGVTSGKLFGRGIVDATYAPTFGRVLRVNNSSGVTVDGVVLVNKQHWAFAFRKANNCVANNVKVISQRYWTGSAMAGTPDGIDVVASSNITVTNCFVRSYDDSLTVKSDQAGGGWATNVSNVTFDGCVVYQGWGGNALEIGWETPNPITNVVWRNIDIIAKKSRTGDAPNVGGVRDALSIYTNQASTVNGVTYENIYVERTSPNYIGIITAVASSGVSNVSYKNVVFYDTDPAGKPINIQGLVNAPIAGVTFENIRFGGPNGKTYDKTALNITPSGSDSSNYRAVAVSKSAITVPLKDIIQTQGITIKQNEANSFTFDYAGSLTAARFYVSSRLSGAAGSQIGTATINSNGTISVFLSAAEAVTGLRSYKLVVADSSNNETIVATGQIYVTQASTSKYSAGNNGSTGITFDATNGSFQTATLTGTGALNIATTNQQPGAIMTLRLQQDATGSRVPTYGSNIKNAGTLTLSTGANAVDVLTYVFDGTYWRERSRALGQAA